MSYVSLGNGDKTFRPFEQLNPLNWIGTLFKLSSDDYEFKLAYDRKSTFDLSLVEALAELKDLIPTIY